MCIVCWQWSQSSFQSNLEFLNKLPPIREFPTINSSERNLHEIVENQELLIRKYMTYKNILRYVYSLGVSNLIKFGVFVCLKYSEGFCHHYCQIASNTVIMSQYDRCWYLSVSITTVFNKRRLHQKVTNLVLTVAYVYTVCQPPDIQWYCWKSKYVKYWNLGF